MSSATMHDVHRQNQCRSFLDDRRACTVVLFCGSNQKTIHDDVLFSATTLDSDLLTTNTLLISDSTNAAERGSAEHVRG